MNLREKTALLFWPVTAPIRFIQEHFKATLLVIILLMAVTSGKESRAVQENLYRIDVSGPIFESESFFKEMEKAEAEHVKGLLLVVNSPGGMVPPSVEMMMAVKEYAKTRPVVVYASGLLASGSYYASIWADEIIANPASIVGSIGVIFQGFNVKGLLDKVGVRPNVIKTGKYKEIGAVYRDWEEYERTALATLSEDVYKMFVSDVAKARKLDPKKEKVFADGKVFIASKAKDVGLIDAVGSMAIAKKRLAELANVKEPLWNKKSRLESFMAELSNESSSLLAKNLHVLQSGVE